MSEALSVLQHVNFHRSSCLLKARCMLTHSTAAPAPRLAASYARIEPTVYMVGLCCQLAHLVFPSGRGLEAAYLQPSLSTPMRHSC